MPKNKSQIIMGIDPGLAATGYALIKKAGNQLTKLDYGCVKTRAGLNMDKRLKQIYQAIKKIIKKGQPDIIAIEKLFFCRNVKTALQVGQAQGVLFLAVSQSKTLLQEFTPLQVKQAVTGYGQADKQQVQKMVKVILNLKQIPKPDDAADALAIAICCAHRLKQ